MHGAHLQLRFAINCAVPYSLQYRSQFTVSLSSRPNMTVALQHGAVARATPTRCGQTFCILGVVPFYGLRRTCDEVEASLQAAS